MRVLIALTLLLSISFSSWASFGDDTNNAFDLNPTQTFATVDEAFEFNAEQNNNALNIDWKIKPGYYLYQSKIKISGKNLTLSQPGLPAGIEYEDEFFGQVTVYTEPLFLSIPLSEVSDGAQVSIEYQGCAKAGFCYPPKTQIINIRKLTPPQATSSAPESEPVSSDLTSNHNDIASALASHKLTLLLMFVFGIGLAFTPCVLPMYPILTGIVLGQANITKKRAFTLSLVYVQGMALTYTLLGLVVASAGLQFQAALQSPIVLISISIVFILLALSMFGVYTLQLPNALQTKLTGVSNHQKSGHYLGVFLMGAISGLVCSPCTTAPLSGALLYVAQTGNLILGGVALYLLGLGMGTPLVAVAVFGQKILPKSGEWMNRVKALFGFILLAAPIFLIERLIPELWGTLLWSALGFSLCGWILITQRHVTLNNGKRALVCLIAILGMLGFIGYAANSAWHDTENQAGHHSALPFVHINSLSELNEQLSLAKQNNQPVMLDFYADWCVACKEFERYTFSQPNVQQALANYVVLQIDVTKNTKEDQAILNHLKVLGLPTIDFWDTNGQFLPQKRVTGFMKADKFEAHISQ